MRIAIACAAFACGVALIRTQDGNHAVTGDQAVTKDQVDKWMTEISNWNRWGKDDQRGTLNLITPEKRRQALKLARDGVSISLAHTLDKEKFPDNPRPIGQQMTLDAGGHATDLYTIWYHGAIMTRAVLVDLPRLKNVDYLEPGTPVYPADIEAWEKFAGLKITSGDAVFLRTGRWARRAKLGPWNVAASAAGWHASVMPWMKQRDVALLGNDGVGDVPGGTGFPLNPIATF